METGTHYRNRESGLNIMESILWLIIATIVLLSLFMFFTPSIYSRVEALLGIQGSAHRPEQSAQQSATPGQGHSAPSSPAPSVEKPDAPQFSPLVAALFASLLASIAWNVKQLTETLMDRARLCILEILSSGQRLSRPDLFASAKRETFLLRLFPEALNQSLLGLVMAGKVNLNDGTYSIPYDGQRIITSGH